MPGTRNWLVAALLLALAGLSGCSSTPVRREPVHYGSYRPPTVAARVVRAARAQVGVPYRYGGESPRGFDCSGLVRYAYRRAGIDIPRTSHEQLRYARRISMRWLRPGDELFFRVSRRGSLHVGIYVGHGRFIHAPSSGERVSYASLNNPYWRRRVIGAGRF